MTDISANGIAPVQDAQQIDPGPSQPLPNPDHCLLKAIERLADAATMSDDGRNVRESAQAALAFAQTYVALHPDLSPVVLAAQVKAGDSGAAEQAEQEIEAPEPQKIPVTPHAVGLVRQALQESHGIDPQHFDDLLTGAQLHLNDLEQSGTPSDQEQSPPSSSSGSEPS